MSTKHTFTHADGTVSKRTSANRVYPFAVEVRIDNHVEARIEAESAVKAQQDIERFDALQAQGSSAINTEDHHYGRGTDRHQVSTFYYLGQYGAGGFYLGSTGLRAPDAEEEFDLAAAISKARLDLVRCVERHLGKQDDLLAGPQYSYGIHSWTSRADLAQKEASRMSGKGWRGRRFSVVEATYVTK